MGSDRFEFGKNWHDFITRYLTPERQERARASLCDFLQLSSLDGRSFLDIGCGSGLFSLAAYQLGAGRIDSFDYDPFSVQTTERLRATLGSAGQWKVQQGSVLDEHFLSTLSQADIVYAWGCLHHTGSMWQAIRNAAARVAENGLFYLAIYNAVEGPRGSRFWLGIKKRYNQSSRPVRRLMELAFMGLNVWILPLTRLESPFTYMKTFSGSVRGMNIWVDLKDWLGGYPYEFATSDEIIQFVQGQLGMELVHVRAVKNLDNNEFLFRRISRPKTAAEEAPSR
jgi:2-polyprenyl-6-hydroxyphenyl methylase/3-demethylubiquinone-9 3-methyltransferase